jgi:hypothetical protein
MMSESKALPDYVHIECIIHPGDAQNMRVSTLGRGELFQNWSITLCRMLLIGLRTSSGGTSHPLLADLANDLRELMEPDNLRPRGGDGS